MTALAAAGVAARTGRRLFGVLAFLIFFEPLGAQTTRMPSTLRYGSGLLNIPVAAVVPHLAVVGSYSGFSVDVPSMPLVGPDGRVTGSGASWSRWLSDGAVTLGLRNRAEVGASFQGFAGDDDGGNLVGAFGRFLLLDPERLDGLGLAVGARYLSSPNFAGADDVEPGRLGFADLRLRRAYAGGVKGVDTSWSPYVVASALLPGFDLRFVPDHDFTFVLGWGSGMFSEGGNLSWYAATPSDGWFYGSAVHIEIREHLHLDLMAEHDGLDANLGTQLNMGGVRVGAFLIGANHDRDLSAYRSHKRGASVSVAFCPRRGGLCGPELRDRNAPDTIQLPAPPPDTIVVGPLGAAGSEKEGGGGASRTGWGSPGWGGDYAVTYRSTIRFVAASAARAAPRAVASSGQAYEPMRLNSDSSERALADTITTQESNTRTALAPISSMASCPSVAACTARSTAVAAARVSPSRV